MCRDHPQDGPVRAHERSGLHSTDVFSKEHIERGLTSEDFAAGHILDNDATTVAKRATTGRTFILPDCSEKLKERMIETVVRNDLQSTRGFAQLQIALVGPSE